MKVKSTRPKLTPVKAMEQLRDSQSPLRREISRAMGKIRLAGLEPERGKATLTLPGFPEVPPVGVDIRDAADWKLGAEWLGASAAVVCAGGKILRGSIDGRIRRACSGQLAGDASRVVPKLRQQALEQLAAQQTGELRRKFVEKVMRSSVLFRAMQGDRAAEAFVGRCMALGHPDGPELEEMERDLELMSGVFRIR